MLVRTTHSCPEVLLATYLVPPLPTAGQDFSFKDFLKVASQTGDHPENNLAKSGYLLN